MKKSFFRLLAATLAAVTVFSCLFSIATFATEEPETNTGETWNNLYEAEGAGKPSETVDGELVAADGWVTSKAIPVFSADAIYWGLCNLSQDWYIAAYDANGAKVLNVSKGDSVADDKAEIHEAVGTDRAIMTWTVPTGVAKIRVTTNAKDIMVVTKDQPFSYAQYPQISAAELNNVYRVEGSGIPGKAVNGTFSKNSDYVGSTVIAVTEGDDIYFGACNTSQKWHIAAYKADGTLADQVEKGDSAGDYSAVLYSTITSNRGILKWTVPAGVTQIRITTNVDDYEFIATKNQPFDKAMYQSYVELIDGKFGDGEDNSTTTTTAPVTVATTDSSSSSTPGVPKDALKGLKGLFIGDSITQGTRDYTPPSQGKSWAGRIAAQTGLKIKNAGAGGSAIAYRDYDDRWIFNQYTANKSVAYDIVVMHGGVNDARGNIQVGTILDTNDEATLKSKITTFAGGLQWLFYNANKTWPNAKLFYIANFRIDGHTTGRAQDMTEYFAVAKQLCDKYGIIYIDLYGNSELTAKIQPLTKLYLVDLLHPSSEGYDIITPYVLAPILDAVKQSDEANTTVTTAVPTTAAPTEAPTAAPTETPTDAPTVAPTDAPTDAPTEAPTDAPATDAPADDAEKKGGCSATVIGGLSVIMLVSCAAVAVMKKRKQ